MILTILAAILLGISKAGLKGPGVAIVGMVAIDFGSKPSTGILLPLLIFADILAVLYYKRNVQWHYLLKLLPMMAIGVILGAFIGDQVPAEKFKFWMAIIIMVGLMFMILKDYKWRNHIPESKWFSGFMGLTAGFTTMVGNLAGPFANLYFMSQNIKKNEFIGTAAWLFFVINIFKLPFHIWQWETINYATFLIDLKLFLWVFLGFVLGVKIVSLINEYWYRAIIYIATSIGAILIIFS